jgi:hypothetical protein
MFIMQKNKIEILPLKNGLKMHLLKCVKLKLIIYALNSLKMHLVYLSLCDER